MINIEKKELEELDYSEDEIYPKSCYPDGCSTCLTQESCSTIRIRNIEKQIESLEKRLKRIENVI